MAAGRVVRAGAPLDGDGEPLQVTAHMGGPFIAMAGTVALDALLAATVARVERLPPPIDHAALVPIDIPVALSSCGRYHLCSHGISAQDAMETVYINTRFPVEQAQGMRGPKVRRLQLSTGATKSHRLPKAAGHAEFLRWYCIGDPERIRGLLRLVGYIGSKRSVGFGRVRRWDVAPVEPWPNGFPVVLDGAPMRPLPADHPGVAPGARMDYGPLSYPYWQQGKDVARVVP